MKTSFVLLFALILLQAAVCDNIQTLENGFGNVETRQLLTDPDTGKTISRYTVRPGRDQHVPRQKLGELGRKLSNSISLENFDCDNQGPDYFRMVPDRRAHVEVGSSATFPGTCFRDNTASLLREGQNSFKFILNSRHATSWACIDWYVISNLGVYQKVEQFFGDQLEVIFTDLSDIQTNHMLSYGLTLFKFCDGFKDTITDILLTAQMFLEEPMRRFMPGSEIPDEKQANRDFLREAIGYEFVERNNTLVDYTNLDLQPGTIFTQFQPSGLHSLIFYGCGSVASHTAILLRDETTQGLIVCESTDVSVYRSVKWGIQCSPLEDYLNYHYASSVSVNALQLSDEYQAKFNNTAAYEWAQEVYGSRYGYESFLFAHFDTADHNLPPMFTVETFWMILAFAEMVEPTLADLVFTDGLNKRMGTEGKTIPEIADLGHQQGLSLGDIIAMVEQEGWQYSHGPAYVCSSFATGTLKRGGIFADLEIEATEFTPTDLYQLGIYRETKNVNCTDNQPEYPYCQLFGPYKFGLNYFNSVPLTTHMSERCPSEPPLYLKTPGC